MEFFPGKDCSNVHEASKIQKNVETAVDLVVAFLGLVKIHAAPVECIARNKTCEQVIGTNRSADTDDEELCKVG